MLENVLYCIDFLQESPKWRSFEEGNELGNNKRKRPAGQKKTKQLKADIEVIKKITGNTKEKRKKEANMKKHRKAQRSFMESATSGMSAIVSVLAEQNETRLLEMMTPKSRNQMAKKMFKLRMQKYGSSRAADNHQITTASSEEEEEEEQEEDDDDVDNDEEDIVETTRRNNFKRHYDSDGKEVVDADNESNSQSSEEIFFEHDSPGDNRVRGPDGVLRLPSK
jgi:hypothetical protein